MVLIKVSVIVALVPEVAALLIPATASLLHPYVGVGLVLLVIVYVLDTLLHQLAVEALVIIEVGLTVTVTSFVVPAHPFTVGIIK